MGGQYRLVEGQIKRFGFGYCLINDSCHIEIEVFGILKE
jgi:hypothetical protein